MKRYYFKRSFEIRKSVAVICSAFLFLFLIFADKTVGQSILQQERSERDILLESLHDSSKAIKKPDFKMKKDPWKAVLYSALLPGAGQVYNKSYWKTAVIAGLGIYFGYGIVNNNNLYRDYKSLYEQSQSSSNPTGNLQLKTFRDFYRDQRDDFIIYAAILYVANLVDAYVDAQLFDFDVSDLRNHKNSSLKIKIPF